MPAKVAGKVALYRQVGATGARNWFTATMSHTIDPATVSPAKSLWIAAPSSAVLPAMTTRSTSPVGFAGGQGYSPGPPQGSVGGSPAVQRIAPPVPSASLPVISESVSVQFVE